MREPGSRLGAGAGSPAISRAGTRSDEGRRSASLHRGSSTGAPVRVWDLAVRIFHWSLVTSFAVAWLAEEGESLHEIAGYAVLGLVAFRLLWGFVGTVHARFADFVPSPSVLIGYLRAMLAGRARRHIGHNPAGGAMIVVLLVMLALASGSGWLMTTDRFWGENWLEDAHEILSELTLVLIALHVAGVLISSIAHRENLVVAMITGRKRPDEEMQLPSDSPPPA